MARAASTAASAVEAPPAPLCLICGDDDFTVKQRAKILYLQWCAEVGGMDHEMVDAAVTNAGDALNAISKLRMALDTLPFFGGGKVVWFQNVSFLGEDRTSSSSAVTAAIGSLAEDLKKIPWNSVRLVISAAKADKRKSFYKTVEKLGTVENYSALSADDKDWSGKAEAEAIKLIRSKGKDISDEALAELVSRVGPNIALLTSEIEKLSLLLGDRPEITAGDIRTSVSRQKVARAFALAEALGDRNLPKLIKTLDEELWEIRTGADKKKSEIGLLYGLITKIRNMILLKELKTAGILKPSKDYYSFKAQLETVNPDSLPSDKRFNPLASHPFVLFQAMRQTDNYDLPELIRAMELMLDANRNLVTSGLDEAMVLQKLVLDIAAAPRAAKAR
ncbi:MAG TPA: DNA polymerase III subunit delta [Candidatus Limnocylindria bacterium]|jgi:DNA polymerase-3 subunit delta|nr:DNA polymerase III subunit delta [Candidatus Limnocylindria bacterium]